MVMGTVRYYFLLVFILFLRTPLSYQFNQYVRTSVHIVLNTEQLPSGDGSSTTWYGIVPYGTIVRSITSH